MLKIPLVTNLELIAFFDLVFRAQVVGYPSRHHSSPLNKVGILESKVTHLKDKEVLLVQFVGLQGVAVTLIDQFLALRILLVVHGREVVKSSGHSPKDLDIVGFLAMRLKNEDMIRFADKKWTYLFQDFEGLFEVPLFMQFIDFVQIDLKRARD
jgi:hypothetical protein